MAKTLDLIRFDEVTATERPRSARGALQELELGASALDTQAAARAALGWGLWNHGHLCEDFNNSSVPAWGGITYVQDSQPDVPRLPGMRSGDHGIGVGTGGFQSRVTDTTGTLRPGTTQDLAVLMAIADRGAGGSLAYQFLIADFSTREFSLYFDPVANNLVFVVTGTTGTQSASLPGVLAAIGRRQPFVIGCVLERGTAKMRTGLCVPGSSATVSAESAAGGVGAVDAGSNFIGLGNATEPSVVAHRIVSHGVDAAKGVSANFATILERYAAQVASVPAVVDAAAGRGRSFVALSRTAYEAQDVVPGATLATRNCSVQALVRFDIADQAAATTWSLTKIDAGVANAWDAGASSTETFAGDGYVEHTPAATTKDYMIGLSDVDVDVDFATIDYAIFVRSNGTIEVYENGTVRGNFGAYAVGDQLRVERVGTSVVYKNNGNVFYTSGIASSGALRADVSIFTALAVVARISLGAAGSPTAITWQNVIKVAIAPSGYGALYARGKATGAAEYLSAGVELRVVNASQAIGELGWLWQTSAGVLKRQVGGQFEVPASGEVLLTATRRWVGTTEVVLRYFVGDQMINEITSTDGDIGGGTTGTTTIGGRFDGTAWGDFFDGVIDELRVVDYELTPEEIEATWKRISLFQPRGYRAIRDLFPPDAPISDSPTSRIQKLLNLAGNAVGYAAAQVENLRQNLMPDHAYGAALERWESITKEPPKALDSVDTRRARVLGHLRQRAGFSLTGLKAALSGLIATSPDNLQFVTFDQNYVERYDNLEQWSYDTFRVTASTAWTKTAGLLSLNAPAAPAVYDSTQRDWMTADQTVSHSDIFKIHSFQLGDRPGVGLSAHLLTKIAPTTIPSKAEVGVAFFDFTKNNTILFGLRNNAGTYQLVTERFVAGISQGVTVRATTALQAHWLHLYQDGPTKFGDPIGFGPYGTSGWDYVAAWSTTSALAGYTSYSINGQVHPSVFHWASLYFRTFDVGGSTTPAANTVVDFDDTRLWTPFGDRPFRFFAYRDPALAGSPDVAGAHNVIQGLKQAQTDGTLITSKSCICDTPGSVFDRGCGGGF